MIGCLHSYMKVGIVNFMAFPGPYPVVDAVSKIATDEFFGGIEVTHIEDPAERAKVAKILATSHLVVGYGAQPDILGGKLNLNSLEEETRIAAVKAIQTRVDEAYSLGCTSLVVLSGRDPGDAKRSDAVDALVRSLLEISRYAKERGDMNIALEVFDQEIDKKALIGKTADAVAVSKAVREHYPGFGLVLDLSHLPLQRETSAAALNMAKDHLVHAHIGNCSLQEGHPAYGDLHPAFGIPGGVNDVMEVREFLRILLSIGYLGEGKQNGVAFEVKPQSAAEPPEVVIANAKRTLMEAWAGV
ncbi:MAG: sugar phosphate isomerase/epimerase family protein [Chloroflexota bacterium]